MKKRDFIAAALGAVVAAGARAQEARPRTGAAPPINSGRQTSSVDPDYKPRRFNKVIELWEDGQPA